MSELKNLNSWEYFTLLLMLCEKKMRVVKSNVERSLAHWLHPTQRLQKDCGSIKASTKIPWHWTLQIWICCLHSNILVKSMIETMSFHEDGKLTAANILSVFYCALQAIPTALTAFTLISVMEVPTETRTNSFSTLSSEHRSSCCSETPGPSYSACLQKKKYSNTS